MGLGERTCLLAILCSAGTQKRSLELEMVGAVEGFRVWFIKGAFVLAVLAPQEVCGEGRDQSSLLRAGWPVQARDTTYLLAIPQICMSSRGIQQVGCWAGLT